MGALRGFRIVAAVATMLTGLLLFAGSANAAPPVAQVTGPIPVSESSYPFLATDIDLEKYGYVEEEFFLEGEAYRYDTSGGIDETATPITEGGANNDGLYPFKTRIVVRRPADPADANKVVVAEWNNVTSTRDVEFNWFGDPYYLLANGYTFVGVTAQTIGINSLKAFNDDRYGTLTVNGNGTVPTGEGIDGDALSYDVFSAVAWALKGGGTGVDPLGGIDASVVIASGESQSCGRLSNHYNKIQPLHQIVDAYLLTVCSSQLRTDRPEKAVRIITETENRTARPTSTYPDTDSIRHWEVAAASHLPRIAFDNLNGVFSRDFAVGTASCEKFPLSRIKWPFTQNAAIDALVDWTGGGAAPPIAPRGEYLGDGSLARDDLGIALGAIRYPDVTVPTALNDGTNAPGEGGGLFSAFCFLFGSSTPFSPKQLHTLYRDHADYVAKYVEAADELVKTGFILQQDANRLKQDAREYARLRPSVPKLLSAAKTRGKVRLRWAGTAAPDTTWRIRRSPAAKKASWKNVKPNKLNGRTANLKREPQGTHVYRVRNTTVLPGTNISPPEEVTTPFSEFSRKVKVDRSGPRPPRIVLKGKRVRKGVFRGQVRVRVIGRADRRLPDGSSGVGLNRKSVPKTRVIRKKGRTVIKVRTRDRLGNRSRVTRVAIRIVKR